MNELGRKLARKIYMVDRRNITHAQIHPRTQIELMVDCGFPPPRPGDPPIENLVFVGVPLAVNDSVPEGELWLENGGE